jgi:hypothetical protein
MGDLINRRTAIDAMNEVYCHIEMVKKRPVNKTEQAVYLDMIGAVKSVPSAQPEIIRCKDCKWKQGAECVRFAEIRVFPDDFCSRAERRTNGCFNQQTGGD